APGACHKSTRFPYTTLFRSWNIGGGALYDIGCYGIVAGRFLFETEPRRAVVLVDRDPALRTDCMTSALIDFGRGRQLSFVVSTQDRKSTRLNSSHVAISYAV